MTVQIANTEAKWLELRKSYITASEAAIILGLNPYSSPNKLKTEKVESTFKGNSFTRVGQVLEPVVVEVTNEIMGTNFKLYESGAAGKSFFTNGRMGATPDAVEGDVLLECKTTRPHTFEKYKENAPLTYLTQLQVQLHCTNKEVGYLAIMSTDLTMLTEKLIWPIIIYRVNKNVRFCMLLESEIKRFLEEPTFRVNSKNKKDAQMLLSMCNTKVHFTDNGE